MNKKLVFVLLIFCFVSKIFTADLDQLPVKVSGSSHNDAMDWMESARTKYIHGVWHLETDDWKPIYLVTLHSILKWVSFSIFGLNDLGMKFWEILFVVFMQGILLSRIPKNAPIWQQTSLVVFIVFSGTLLATSRQASLDSVQIGLIFIGFWQILVGMETGRPIKWLIGATLVNVGVVYKLSALLMAGVPFSVILLKHFLDHPNFSIAGLFSLLKKRELHYSILAAVLVFGSYLIFFLIPYGDEFTYFSWRIFGVKANIIAPWDYRTISRNSLNLFSTGWTNVFDISVRKFHLHWAFFLLTIYPYSIYLSVDKSIRRPIDVLFASVIPLFFLQIILFDMQWRRYFILIPLVFLFLLRFVERINDTEVNSNRFRPSPPLQVACYLLLFYGTFIFIAKFIFQMNWMDGLDLATLKNQYVSILAGILGSTGIVILVFKFHTVKLLKTSFLYLVFFFFLLDSLRGAYELFAAPKTLSTASKTLDSLVQNKDAKVFMDSELHLYHKLRTNYVGSWPGGWKPESRWENNLSLKEYVEKVLSVGKQHQDFKIAIAVKRVNDLYPGFVDRWNLPADYETKYKSNCILDGRQQLAKKFLLIGCSEPKIYFVLFPFVDKDPWIYYDIMRKRKNNRKVGEIVIRDDLQAMDSIFSYKFDKTKILEVNYSEN